MHRKKNRKREKKIQTKKLNTIAPHRIHIHVAKVIVLLIGALLSVLLLISLPELAILGLITALACVYLAQHNKRDTAFAFLMGFLFGLIGVVAYAIIGKKSA